jgi:hypothetical protein
MTRQLLIGNSILWAAAIVGSALLHAPTTVTLVILPMLAATFLVISVQRQACGGAATRGGSV